ncbi:MAG: ATP-binding cassette domain-containing protein [Clostridiales bacterium]|nr:ATP-binding cassette domain-containing protein [Clostridiales bacterium]
MLVMKNIKKTYCVGGIETRALDDISVAFRQKEFVAILGTSGSGKTTCLNIIGGLDRYDSGELVIKGKKTSDFKDRDWDAYRNNSIGFVFQSYNLIMHLSIVANVELGMTLSGVSAHEKRKRALAVLTKVGLKEHLHKKPNQLSGGQMQRVAIARALANDPEILLCDEPTGALDSKTSTQIMDLIKEVAGDRLVIMVTHNQNIAERYADRIIRFHDGKITADSRPYTEEAGNDAFSLKKTSMSFLTALRLSFNNLKTKKGRTFLTAFASSIGIIGIAVILSLSTGFQKQIDEFQRDAMSEFPIIISQTAMTLDREDMAELRDEMQDRMLGTLEYADSDEVFLYDPAESHYLHTNVFTDAFMNYLSEIDPEICSNLSYTRLVSMNMLREIDGIVMPVTIGGALTMGGGRDRAASMTSTTGFGLSSYPKDLKSDAQPFLEKNYDLLGGAYPEKASELILVIDEKNRIDYNVLKNLGIDTQELDSVPFTEIVGIKLKIITNDDYYIQTEYGSFIPGTDYAAMYDSENSIEAEIVGIVRPKKDVSMALLGPGIAYSDELSEMIIESALNSQIVKAQENSQKNIMTMQDFESEEAKTAFMSYLGGNATPYLILVFPDDFEDKDRVMDYLEAYNQGKADDDLIVATDLAGTMSQMTGGIMDGITIVLIAFAAISLVVSLIMISIITYTSVLERTKEIGILRALGARKRDISRVFNAETCILGAFSGLLGILIAWLLTFPINAFLYRMTELRNVATLVFAHAVLLIIISTVLTVLGGYIPAKMASRKEAVVALRTE